MASLPPLFRAIDQFGQVIDVFPSPLRDAAAARRFFDEAIGGTRVSPAEVITDRCLIEGMSGSTHRLRGGRED